MIISIIVAVGNNNVIGVDNALPWHLPADLKYFKAKTIGKPVIMGRKSYESIGRPLPGRTNIVISRNPEFQNSGLKIARSISDAFLLAQQENPEEIFVIGGSKIYEQTMDLWDTLYLTKVDVDITNATAFFPELDMDKWICVNEDPHKADEQNPHDYTFYIYKKK